MTELTQSRATDIVKALKTEKVSPHDLLDALEARIGKVDTQVNALPILCFDRARREADRIMKRPVNERGLLCGMPVPIKDLDDVKGVRTSFGSVPFADYVAPENCYMVDRLESEGAIVYAKSNTPEFGAGGNTFNDVHGVTRNPHNLDMSAAGSSGGAAAALASGTAWLAQGSDNAGSLRSPASFCGIVGFRPTPGLVVRGPSAHPYQTLLSNGPMARNVEDVALFLDAMAGQDMRDPLSLPPANTSYLTAAQSRTKPVKVAFSADLGITPVDPEIAGICQRAAQQFTELGIAVEEASPDFTGVHECYHTLRAHEFSLSMNDMSDDIMAQLKPELAENLEKGRGQNFADIAKASKTRGVIRNRVLEFFETYDLLLVPTTIVGPYPVEQRFVTSCNGQDFKTYIDWLAIAYAITLVSLPALSLPCGFTRAGMPVGLQMVGRPRGEHALLASALVLEEALDLDLRPIVPNITKEIPA